MPRQRMIGSGATALALALCVGLGIARPAATPTVVFHIFTQTSLRLTGVLWTGQRFLYIDNTTNYVAASGPSGAPLTRFAQMPRQVEETRCRVAPSGHGFVQGEIFCHAPDNKIYRLSADGTHLALFATLPGASRSDGSLAFDTVGRFGYALIAATGRSGSASPGGLVFALSSTGAVRRLGQYPGPGGADEIAIAPAGFGALAGQVLIPADAGPHGRLLAMDSAGRVRLLLALSDGPNPVVALTADQGPAAGAARPGFYVADTASRAVYYVPASALIPFRGDVLMGSELRGLFWVIQPRGAGVAARLLATNLTARAYNFEDGSYIAPGR